MLDLGQSIKQGGQEMRKIASLRIDKGVSVNQMAEDMEVTTQTIYNWQNAQPDLPGEVIIKLCRYFNISSDDLLGLNIKEAV